MSTVRTQAELDKAIADKEAEIVIDSPAGVWLELRSDPSSRVVARGSSSVVARESSRVVARGSSRVVARGSSSVVAWESSSVEARESSSVEAWESSSVEAWESSSVEAWDSSRVEARGSSRVVAGKYVAVHLHSQRVTLSGGVVIDMTAVDASKTQDWIDLTGAKVTDGRITVYKAVDADLKSGLGFTYPIGVTVEEPDYRDDHDCGAGLHLSPSPHAAKEYFREATRFLECTVAVEDVSCIDATKLKARRVTVVREIDMWTREPIESGAVSA